MYIASSSRIVILLAWVVGNGISEELKVETELVGASGEEATLDECCVRMGAVAPGLEPGERSLPLRMTATRRASVIATIPWLYSALLTSEYPLDG